MHEGTMTEYQLIEKCKRKDPVAQRELYERYARKMLFVCQRYANDTETARDLLQDGFVKVFTSLDSFSFSGSLEGWIRRIMVNTALEYLRRNDLLRDAADLSEHYEMYAEASSPLEDLSAKDLMNMIYKLPPGFRTVFNLYAIEGYSHKEIADMLHVTESTSRSQYTRAKKFLQRLVVASEKMCPVMSE